MSKPVVEPHKEKVGAVRLVECPNIGCSHQFPVNTLMLGMNHRCPKCKRRFMPRNQVVSK